MATVAPRITDIHTHLLPGVDDGAADPAEALEALARLCAQGVRTVIVTPHMDASVTLHPLALEGYLSALEASWGSLRSLVASEFPDLRTERGVELLLDVPEPDLSEPALRLGGTMHVLVEFPFMSVPSTSAELLATLSARGYKPVVAHPERYANLASDLRVAARWRDAGARLQVNASSLIGQHGPLAQRLAWSLLAVGWVDYVASDHHARGPSPLEAAREELLRIGGEEAARRLLEENPRRLLEDQPPLPVHPVPSPRRPLRWM